MLKTLEELIAIIRQRKGSSAEESYTYKLLKNKKLSVEKIKEEIAELIQAIEKNTNKVHEAADVLYHLMVLSTLPNPTSEAEAADKIAVCLVASEVLSTLPNPT